MQILQSNIFLFLSSAAVGCFLPLLVAFLYSEKSKWSELAILICGLSFLGAAAGFAGGMSRVGVVGEVVAASLALAGGVSAYLFGVDRSKGTIASLGAAAFAIALIAAFSAGSENRVATERYALARDNCYKLLTDGDFVGNRDAMCVYARTLSSICASVLTKETYEFGLIWGAAKGDEAKKAYLKVVSDQFNATAVSLENRACDIQSDN